MSSFTNGRSLKFALGVSLLCLVQFQSCTSPRGVNAELDSQMPKKIVWAWERPEDLRFLDPQQFGVAFLAQTLFLDKEAVDRVARRQPLEVNNGTYLIAVTRIETRGRQPSFSAEQQREVVDLVMRTLDLPNVRAIQLDFDAVVSEREFYRRLVAALRTQIDARQVQKIPFSITALASWCAGDNWFGDMPIDEAVPMVFVMGPDTESIRGFLHNGNDWRAPLCRGSYGLSVDESPILGLLPGRRLYYFKKSSWNSDDLTRMQ